MKLLDTLILSEKGINAGSSFFGVSTPRAQSQLQSPEKTTSSFLSSTAAWPATVVSNGNSDKSLSILITSKLAGNSIENLKFADCEVIESAIRLTPPVLIDKLCKGELLPPVSDDAIFIEELLEIARKLNRMHLVIIVKGDP
jgi:hypothetical protein